MPATYTDRLDGLTASVAVKAPCIAATTAAITLSGTQTVDGIALAVDNRVLVKDQAASSANGIYLVRSSTWVRATDWDGARDAVGGTLVYISSGTTNGNSFWKAGGSGSISIGTTSVTFSRSEVTDASVRNDLSQSTGAGLVGATGGGTVQEAIDDITSDVSTLQTDTATVVAGLALIDNPYRLLFGLEPEKLSGTELNLQAGAAADQYGTEVLRSTSALTINLATNGALGLDTGTITSGEDYYVYLLKTTADGSLSALVSTSISYGGVTVPSGYTMHRKLPWGFIYNTTSGWGVTNGIPDFHLTHWPKPLTTFTAFQFASPFLALTAGTSTTFASVDLTPWLPDNARLARIACRVNYSSGAGKAYVRTYGTQSTGIEVGRPTAASDVRLFMFDMRTTSTRLMSYKVDSGVTLDIGVMGYSQTEPS